MKVLWFSNTPAYGENYLQISGVRGGWLKSLDRAIKNKVELHIAFYFTKYVEPFEYEGVHYYPISNLNWKFNVLKKIVFGEFIDQDDLPLYLSIINQVQPDVIHIHGSENPFGCLFTKTDIPVVMSFQGCETVNFHKYFSGIEKEYLTGMQFDMPSLKSFITQTTYKRQFKKYAKTKERELRNLTNCPAVIGRTDWDRRVSRVLSPASIYYCNNEVLRSVFYHSVWDKTFSEIIIVHSTIGDSFTKGLETICETLFLLHSLGKKIEWRIAGIKVSDVIYKIVRKKMQSRFPTHSLVLLGEVNESDLFTKMNEADIYVMPSHIENSPNNLCEAMIIGSLLTDKVEGILIQDGDPWSMAGAILELHRNPVWAKQLGTNARTRALERHNKEKIVSDLIEIYSSVIDKNKSY